MASIAIIKKKKQITYLTIVPVMTQNVGLNDAKNCCIEYLLFIKQLKRGMRRFIAFYILTGFEEIQF